MTDKQIIIDGVDVSRCEYLDNIDFDELCLMLSSPYECQVNCSNKPNCYYKQLKRKEQKLSKINEILEVYYDDDWKATREIERILNDR